MRIGACMVDIVQLAFVGAWPVVAVGSDGKAKYLRIDPIALPDRISE